MGAARESLLVVLAAAALYTAAHLSSVPPRAQVPSDLLRCFAPFPPPAQRGFKNELLLDPLLQFEPWLAFNRAELAAGRLPTWNPNQGLGTVHLANDQSAVFSLWSLPYYALGPPGLFLAGMGKAILLCLGLFWFLRDEGLSPAAALLGGLALSACAPVVGWQLHPHTGAFAYVGLLLFLSGRTVRAERWINAPAIGLAVVTGLTLVAGHQQLALQVALITGLWTLVSVARRAFAEGPGAAVQGGVQAVAAAGLGLALAAVHLLPFVEALGMSEAIAERSGSGHSVRVPVKFLALGVFPDLHGSPRDGYVSPVFGSPGYLEQIGPYAGAALVALALLNLSGVRRAQRGLAWTFAGVALAAGLVVYGPLDEAFAALPPFGSTRNHRMTFLIALAVCVLGAIGFDRALRGRVRAVHVGWVALLLGLASYVALGTVEAPPVASFTSAEWPHGWIPGPLGRSERGLAFAVAVPLAGAAATLAFVALRPRLGRRRVALGVGAAVALELLAFGYEFAPGVPAEQVRPPLPGLAVAKGERLLCVGPRALWANLGAAYGARQVNVYDALGNQYVSHQLDRLATFKGTIKGALVFDDREADRLGVRYVLTDQRRVARNLLRGVGPWLPLSQGVGGQRVAIPEGGVGVELPFGEHEVQIVAFPDVRCAEVTSFTLAVSVGGVPVGKVEEQRAPGTDELLFRVPRLRPPAGTRVRFTLTCEPTGAEVLWTSSARHPGTRLHAGREAGGHLTVLFAGALSEPYRGAHAWTNAWLLENPDAGPRWRASGASLRLVSETSTEVVLACESSASTRLLLADAYTPGWSVSIDGAPATLRNADGLRAVDVPAGTHTVRFVHTPQSVRRGLLHSLSALALILLGALAAWRASRQPSWTGRP